MLTDGRWKGRTHARVLVLYFRCRCRHVFFFCKFVEKPLYFYCASLTVFTMNWIMELRGFFLSFLCVTWSVSSWNGTERLADERLLTFDIENMLEKHQILSSICLPSFTSANHVPHVFISAIYICVLKSTWNQNRPYLLFY